MADPVGDTDAVSFEQDYSSPSEFVSVVSKTFTSEINCGKLDLFLSAKYSDEERYIGDSSKLQKIVEALISKSIKLTDEKGAVACAMYRKPKRDKNRRVVDLKGKAKTDEFILDYILCADIRIAEGSVAQQTWIDFYKLFEEDLKDWNDTLKDNPQGGIKFQRRQGEMGKVAVFSLSIPLHIVNMAQTTADRLVTKQSRSTVITVSRSRSASGADVSLASHAGQSRPSSNKSLGGQDQPLSTPLAPISENRRLAPNESSSSSTSPRQFNVSNWLNNAASTIFNASDANSFSVGNSSTGRANNDEKQTAPSMITSAITGALSAASIRDPVLSSSAKVSQAPYGDDDRRSSRTGSREPSTHSVGEESRGQGFLRRLLMLKTFTKPESSHAANASSLGPSGVRNFSSSAPDLEQALENAANDDDADQEMDIVDPQQAQLRAASFSGSQNIPDSGQQSRGTRRAFSLGKNSIAPAPEKRAGGGGQQSPRHSSGIQQSPPDSTRKSNFPFNSLPRAASFSNSVVPISDAQAAASAAAANAAASLPSSPGDSARKADQQQKLRSTRSSGAENVRNALSNRGGSKSNKDLGGDGDKNRGNGQQQSPRSSSRRSSTNGQKPRVRFMVVDDHIDDRTHAKDLLVADGQFVTDAPDAIECVRIMKEAAAANEYYDVILLDYDMPPFMW